MYKLCLLIHIFLCIIFLNEGVQRVLMLFSKKLNIYNIT